MKGIRMHVDKNARHKNMRNQTKKVVLILYGKELKRINKSECKIKKTFF